MDTSKDPPEWLINKGGDLSKSMEENIDQRQGRLSTQADYQTGFRCAKDNKQEAKWLTQFRKLLIRIRE